MAAQKAVSEAKLAEVLNDERAQNVKIAKHELETAERQLLVRRDGELIFVVDGSDADVARAKLRELVANRIDAIQGPAGASQTKQILVDIGELEPAVEKQAARYRMLGPTAKDPTLECVDTNLPSSDFSKPLLAQQWLTYQQKCRELKKARAALKAEAKSPGALSAIEGQIEAAAKLSEEVTTNVKRLTAAYKTQAKELAEKRKTGEKDLGKTFKDVKEDLEKIKLPSEPLLANLGALGLKAKLAVDWLDEQRDAIAELIDAAAANPGKVPVGVDDKVQIAAMLPSIYNELAAGFAYPRVTSLVHELNRVGIERDAFQRQVDRANEQIETLERKRGAMLRELTLLIESRAALNSSESACKAIKADKGEKKLKEFATFRNVDGPCGEDLRRALHAYADSWTLGRLPELRADWTITHIDHERALDANEMALREWQSLLAVQLDALVASYATGVKPEDIGRAVHSLELGAIAVGVP